MISLVLSMIRARRAQALTVLLLCVFATGAAVAGPVALAAVDRAVVANELAAAGPEERTVTLSVVGEPGQDSQLEGPTGSLLRVPGFEQIFSVQHNVLGLGTDVSTLAFREQVCDHLVLVRGRCQMSLLEALIGEDTARQHGLAPGDTVTLAFARWNEERKQWEAADPPAVLTVVGVYRPTDVREAYWGRAIYFGTEGDGSVAEPVFASRLTLNSVFYDFQQQLLDQIAMPGSLDADGVAAVRAKLEEINTTLTGAGGDQEAVQPPVTELPALLDRINRNRALAAQMVPVAFVPLVALCWFVIYLAVSYGVFGRRHELGLVALRGVGRARRWWLASGETALVILIGAPIGYFVGHLAVRLAADWRIGGGDGTGPTWSTVPYAVAALLGALLAAQLGQRAELTRSVADLLHRVPGRALGWRSAVFEAMIVVFALLAVAQLRTAGGGPTGVTMLVPGLAMAAVAFVAARAVVPVAAGLSRWALRRGRLGAGLAAVQLARRPGSQRLLVLVTMAVAMLCFVVAAIDVGDGARRGLSTVESGASTVVAVRPLGAKQLIAATEKADPDGAYAMAVASLSTGRVDNRALAVDSRRLAAAAEWRSDFGIDAAQVAQRLRPPAGESFIVKGRRVILDVSNREVSNDPNPVRIEMTFAPLAGGAAVSVGFGQVSRGRTTVESALPQCADGCRLSGVLVTPDDDETAEVVLHELRTGDPGGVAINAEQFGDRSRWVPSGTTRLRSDADGLTVITSDAGIQFPRSIAPTDTPLRLPVVATTELGAGHIVTLADRGQYETEQVGRAAMLPRLGVDGVLVDLEYADRAAATPTPPSITEVWLGPTAPPDAVDRLRAAGLNVLEVTRATDNQARLSRQGPAMAMWFHLVAAVFALILALAGMWLVATVDRRRRAEDLRALRNQGLSRRVVRRATLWGQLTVVLAGTLLGLGAAAVAWLAAGEQLPVVAEQSADAGPLTAAGWPEPTAVLWPWLAALGVLVAVAVIAAIDLRRAVARNGKE